MGRLGRRLSRRVGGDVAVTGPLAGVRVVEVASHVFVPMAGAVLNEWGADVIKIEHPETGDPYRGLVTGGLDVGTASTRASIRRTGEAVGRPRPEASGGSAGAGRLCRRPTCSSRTSGPTPVAASDIDVDGRPGRQPVDHLRAGTAFGDHGPDAGRGGYDAGATGPAAGCSRSSPDPGRRRGPPAPRPAFGDVVGGLDDRRGHRHRALPPCRHGEPSVVDASLLASGMWQIQTDLVIASLDAARGPAPWGRLRPVRVEPADAAYRTADGRFVVAADALPGSLLARLVQGDRPPRHGDRSPLRRP